MKGIQEQKACLILLRDLSYVGKHILKVDYFLEQF